MGRPDAPELWTDRLHLKAHRPEDFDDCAAMWASPEVTRFIGGRPSTAEEVWSRLLRYAGLWALLGFGYWVVRERTHGAFVGEVGFADFRRELEPGLAGAPEMGWALAPQAWGRGYAGEALAAALGWADRSLDCAETACLIAPENAASLRLAARCGFEPYAEAAYHGRPTRLLRRRRPADPTRP